MSRPPSESHVALEQQAETSSRMLKPSQKLLHMCEQYVPQLGVVGQRYGWTEQPGGMQWADAIANLLKEAQTYYVAPHMMEVIQSTKDTMPSFPLTTHNIPCPVGFCYLPVAHRIGPALEALGVTGVPARAFAWTLGPDPVAERMSSSAYGCGTDVEGAAQCFLCGHYHLTMLYWIGFADNDWPGEPRYLVPTGTAFLPLGKGKNWDASLRIVDGDTGREMEDARDSLSMDSLRFFVSFLCFIRQKCIVEVQERAPRSTRRRLPDDWVPEPTIRTILLRRYAEESERQGHSQVDWRCKWWVQGHWRDQWYSSIKAHMPVYIETYIKGPEDKPLKLPDKVVNSVVR